MLLARLFARPANLLVLDEPTNDLDIDTLELLEQLLQDYRGTVIIVSHDRAFLDNVVTQSIVFEGEGRLTEIVGGYADWQVWKSQQAKTVLPAVVFRSTPPPPPTRSTTKAKLSYREARELEGLPGRIAALEAEQAGLAAKLADPALYQTRPHEATALSARSEAIEAELLDALARWEALDARAAAD